MLTKSQFTQALNFALELEDKELELSKALQKYGGETDFMDFGTDFTIRIVTWLEDVMQDDPKSPTISWWIWDAPDRGRSKKSLRTIEQKGKKYDLKTPSDLYDYLIEYPYEP